MAWEPVERESPLRATVGRGLPAASDAASLSTARPPQVKNFGRQGRTKYTHLVDQDTTFIAGDDPMIQVGDDPMIQVGDACMQAGDCNGDWVPISSRSCVTYAL